MSTFGSQFTVGFVVGIGEQTGDSTGEEEELPLESAVVEDFSCDWD